jgi:hypothetical protein
MSDTPLLDECTANYRARVAREEAEEARHQRIEDGLRKAIATFDDMGRVLRLLGRHVLADACVVAADASREILCSPAQNEGGK